MSPAPPLLPRRRMKVEKLSTTKGKDYARTTSWSGRCALSERAHTRSQVCTDTQGQIGRDISSNLANLTRMAACVRPRRGTAIATRRLAVSTPAALVASAARHRPVICDGPAQAHCPSGRFNENRESPCSCLGLRHHAHYCDCCRHLADRSSHEGTRSLMPAIVLSSWPP
jgi:hypothetical protein